MINFLVERRHRCADPEATEEFGSLMAQFLCQRINFPSVILLKGPLGSGKTVFSQGLARGLGISEPLQSPTFPILLEYPGPVPLYHFDLYRLGDSEEFELIGGEDILCGDGSYGPGLSVVEWPERFEWGRLLRALPCWQVELEVFNDLDEGGAQNLRLLHIQKV